MKAIILAAGMGTRLGKYTKDLPKAMLSFNGKPLVEWQIQQLRKAGYNDIIIVTGYKREEFPYDDVKYYNNPEFATTNMVESLLCAKEELDDEVLVCYGDIIYTQEVLQDIANFKGEVGVSADENWKEYWKLRYGKVEFDLESFSIQGDQIVELGKEVETSEGIDLRYIGLIKFSKEGMQKAIKIYNGKKEKQENWSQSGNTCRQGYMTDLLNELIIEGNKVQPIVSNRGWMEFDTVEDYEVMRAELDKGAIDSAFFN